MKQDIDLVLDGWPYKTGIVQARMMEARDGRQIIQMRVDLGVLQMETVGRPDGSKPHGHPTYFGYLKEQNRIAHQGKEKFVIAEEQCQEADREFVQFYHRRICWLSLRHYARAVADADHTLNFMDFVKRHSPSEEYTQAHEQYRGFVLFQRTQAATALQVEKDNPEGAIDELRIGLEHMKNFFAAYELLDEMDDDSMVQHLRKIERSLREEYHIEATLQEKLDQAVAAEDYERAAQLRDELRRRQ